MIDLLSSLSSNLNSEVWKHSSTLFNCCTIMDENWYQFDIEQKVVVKDCDLQPSGVRKDEFHWLWARNNKYKYPVGNDVDREKIGKWMLFVSTDTVDGMWNQVKMAVASGDLWLAKVSTSDPDDKKHVIIIYSKDYSDIQDVIRVLDYLEGSGLKPPGSKPIYYKTDQQTRAGVYRGGSQKPWIYSSATIRDEARLLTPWRRS